MFMRATSKQYVTNWATLFSKSGPSYRKEVESSERHEVLFTRTFWRREKCFSHNSQRFERAIIHTGLYAFGVNLFAQGDMGDRVIVWNKYESF